MTELTLISVFSKTSTWAISTALSRSWSMIKASVEFFHCLLFSNWIDQYVSTCNPCIFQDHDVEEKDEQYLFVNFDWLNIAKVTTGSANSKVHEYL